MPRSWARAAIRFLNEEEGPTAVEYAVMLALIITVCFAAVIVIGGETNSMFTNITLNTTLKGS